MIRERDRRKEVGNESQEHKKMEKHLWFWASDNHQMQVDAVGK